LFINTGVSLSAHVLRYIGAGVRHYIKTNLSILDSDGFGGIYRQTFGPPKHCESCWRGLRGYIMSFEDPAAFPV
jgi:hypothetical protein